jgi:hypothetical protein
MATDTYAGEKVRRTNLEVPPEMEVRIKAQAKIDRRLYRPEIMVLLDEALAAREKAQRK